MASILSSSKDPSLFGSLRRPLHHRGAPSLSRRPPVTLSPRATTTVITQAEETLSPLSLSIGNSQAAERVLSLRTPTVLLASVRWKALPPSHPLRCDIVTSRDVLVLTGLVGPSGQRPAGRTLHRKHSTTWPGRHSAAGEHR
jgi:hypothetical protein